MLIGTNVCHLFHQHNSVFYLRYICLLYHLIYFIKCLQTIFFLVCTYCHICLLYFQAARDHSTIHVLIYFCFCFTNYFTRCVTRLPLIWLHSCANKIYINDETMKLENETSGFNTGKVFYWNEIRWIGWQIFKRNVDSNQQFVYYISAID